MERIALAGAGLIGRAWAISFARAGYEVRLWDGAPTAVDEALKTIADRMEELACWGLLDDASAALARIRPASTLDDCVAGSGYVQESLAEEVDVKREIFSRLDTLCPQETVLASSTSAIPVSAFTAGLPGRARCLVAHPANPPYLLPMVELCGAPWTASETIARAREVLAGAGQAPVHVLRETPGFILNRIQGALLNEAFRLVEEGCVSPQDLDLTVSHGLGLRWAFMGPFETIELNAPDGVGDYCRRYGPFYQRLREDPPSPAPWSPELIARIEQSRREAAPRFDLPARQARRDRYLMRLAALKKELGLSV